MGRTSKGNIPIVMMKKKDLTIGETLRSIDGTLKRIEKLIIQCQNQSCNSEYRAQEDTANSSLQRIKGYAGEYFSGFADNGRR